MQMRPEVQIKSVVKAMTDVVLPAIDPGNKLAQEQARLVVGMLTLMAQQLPLQFRFDRDDLSRQLELASALKKAVADVEGVQTPAEEMDKVSAAGASVLEQSRIGPDQVERVVRKMRAATSSVVRAVYKAGNEGCIEQVEKLVLSASKEQLLRDRSWVLMQGWEPDPAAVPKIEDLLGLPA